ncbi:hypothetical protein DFH06DRAFT_1336579 [Mycena polygramma]|nr:hypothetical protein DFH06DRAFT_1336579 [Mycena polygramma]
MHEDARCVLWMRTVLDKVLSRKDTEHDPRQGPVLRAAMIFLSTRRSEEELKALRTTLVTCNCKPELRATHRPVFRPMDEVLESALFNICSTMVDYFVRIGAGKFLKVKPNTPDDARPWPSSVTDVIPAAGGERDVLLGLMQWATPIPGGHSVFALIGALARYWEPFALQVFDDRNLFSLATEHLRHALNAYRPALGTYEQMNVFVTPVIAIAQCLFHTLYEVGMRVTVSLLPPIYEEMHAIAVEIEPILFSLRSEMDVDSSRRWFRIVRSIRSVIAEGQWIQSTSTNPPQMKRRTKFGAAFHQMVEIRNRNQCLHVKCTTKITQRSSVCSRCGIVRYCGQLCLAAAWDASTLPHKTLCKKITRLRATIGLANEQDWTRTVRDSIVHRSPLNFALLCERKGADPEVADAIWREITCLTDARVVFIAQGAQTLTVSDADDEKVRAGMDGVNVVDEHGASQVVEGGSDSAQDVERG